MDSVSEAVRRVAARIVEDRPGVASHVGTAADDARALVVRSPTDDRERDIVLWDDDGDLGLGFGAWHTHGNIARWTREADDEESALVAIACSIVDDELVIAVDLGGECDGASGLLDLREPDTVLEELTRRGAPNGLRIRTWSGRGDRDVSLGELA